MGVVMIHLEGRRVTFICPEELVIDLDATAVRSRMSRSTVIVQLLVVALERARTVPVSFTLIIPSSSADTPAPVSDSPLPIVDSNVPRPGHGARPSPNQLAVLKRIPSSMVE